MRLNIDPDWLRKMAKKENNKIISVGGFVTRLQAKIVRNDQNKPKQKYQSKKIDKN